MGAETRVTASVCHECYAYCGVLIHVDEESKKISKITANPDHPQGYVCPKGAKFHEIVYHPDRLLYPLKRIGERGEGKWEKITWDEALEYVAESILRIREKNGRRAFAFFPHHIFRYPLWALFMRFLGNNNYISCLDRCDGGAFLSDYAVFGGYLTCSLDWDYDKSGCIVLWGCNPARSFPVYWHLISKAKEKGTKLLVIDPVRTEAAERADLWLRIRPGSDPALALAMIHVIIQEDLYDAEFVKKWCIGFDKLREHVKTYTPESVESVTGVSADQIRAAARMFSTNGPTCFAPMRNGVCHKMSATQSYLAHSILLAITGNVDIPGAELFMKRFEGVLYEADLIYDPKFRLPLEIEQEAWGCKEFPLYFEGCHLSAHSTVIWQAIRDEKIKGMFVVGSDPLMTHANTRESIEAIKKLDILMVSDYFMSPTAEFADIVLPAATWCEKDDIRTRSSDCISAIQKAVDPTGECWNDNAIAIELSKRLKAKGYPYVLDLPWNSVEEFNQFRFRDCSVSFDEVKKMGMILFPKRYRSYEKNGFNTPSGKIELSPSRFEKFGYSPLPVHIEPSESPYSRPDLAKEYPLTLITGSRELEYYHSSHRQMSSMRKVYPDPIFRIHPKTAEAYELSNGNWCWIKTPRGRVKMRTEITDRVLPGTVMAQHGWWFPEDKTVSVHALNDSNINLLTFKGESVDPVMGAQTFKTLLCTVEKAS